VRCVSNAPRWPRDPIRTRGSEQSIAPAEAIGLSKAKGDCDFWLGESIPSLAVSTVWHNKGITGQSPLPIRTAVFFSLGTRAGPNGCMFCSPLEKLIVAQDTGLRFVCNPPKVRRRTIKRAERKNNLSMKTKTLSDYPLLIGEVIRRSEIRRQKKERWKQFWHKTVRLTK
jgi:hypothetical protein